MKKTFTQSETNIAKGLAVLLLLFHHLFAEVNWSLCTPIFKTENILFPKIVLHSKVCVAIFMILSGYGLAKSYAKSNFSDIRFSLSHLLKLMFQYWYIFVLFCFFSFFIGSRNPIELYGIRLGIKGVIKFVIDFFGLAGLFNTTTLNNTWWYMGAIIPLYLAFPLIFKVCKKFWLETLLGSFFLAVIPYNISGRFAHAILLWVFPFVLGVFLSIHNTIEIYINRYSKKRRIFIVGIALITAFCLRTRVTIIADGFFGLSLILFSFELTEIIPLLKKGMAFLGKHSANIFMMHTFIYAYFFKDYFYSLKYPILIYASVLSACIVVSLCLEKTKKLLRYDRLQSKVNKLVCGGTDK